MKVKNAQVTPKAAKVSALNLLTVITGALHANLNNQPKTQPNHQPTQQANAYPINTMMKELKNVLMNKVGVNHLQIHGCMILVINVFLAQKLVLAQTTNLAHKMLFAVT